MGQSADGYRRRFSRLELLEVQKVHLWLLSGVTERCFFYLINNLCSADLGHVHSHVLYQFATVSGLNDMLPQSLVCDGAQQALRRFFSRLAGVTEALCNQQQHVYKPNLNRALKEPPFPLKQTFDSFSRNI